ncbi:unnamed protein product [Moneuplotes crassus]|uniref:Purple acid phosphatase n=1 Tax=Euplotes crassus TaxID=5936 RepID=A0AAD1U649_EUPCR|nr:unnamed protein product [Moneuplotes crassus]
MFESFFPPYQKTYTYKGFSFFANFVILGITICCFLVPTIALHLVQWIKLRSTQRRKNLAERKPDSPGAGSDDENMHEMEQIGQDSSFPRFRQQPGYEKLDISLTMSNSWSFYTLSIAIFVMEILTVFSILGILDLLVMYGYIHQTRTFMFFKYLLWIALIFLVYLRVIFGCRKYQKSYHILSHHKFMCFGALALIFLGFTTSVTTFSSGVCLASHSPLLEGFNIGRFAISTAFMRSRYLSTCSASSYPCLTYMTLPENSVNEMFINFHINHLSCRDWDCKPVLKYTEFENKGRCSLLKLDLNISWKTVIPILSEYSSLPSEYESRVIFTAYLKDLKENTRYIFSITDENADQSSAQFSFKTLNPQKFVLLNGGDIGINPEARDMNKIGLEGHQGELIMIGGDISYDNNIPQCYRATDRILHEIPHARKDLETGYINLIPMIKAPGNHDFGVDSNQNISILHDKYEPLYKHYYTQSSFEGNVPPLRERKSYFYHTIGTTVLIVSLDSGYDTTLYGGQTEWLEGILKKFQDYPIKLVHYHEPFYPACAYATDEIQKMGQKYWIPLFDKYNVTIAFENHNHSLKRTFRLRNNTLDPEGILYIGDGSWGALDNPCKIKDNGFIAKYEAKNHVWEMSIDMSKQEQISLKAIGINKEILDHITLRV